MLLFSGFRYFYRPHQRCCQLLIALEEERHSLGFGFEGGLSTSTRLSAGIGRIHSTIKRLVGFDQFRRHGQRIVEVGQG